MKKFFLVVFLILGNFLFSQIQRADLVFKDGDVIEGFGMITSKNEIKFRISLEDEPDVFEGILVKEIIFYGFEQTKIYEFVKINKNKSPVLLEVISYGEVNLYEKKEINYTIIFASGGINNGFGLPMDTATLSESSTLYLKRSKEDIATKIIFNFKKQAQEYFKDCSIIQELLNSKEYRMLSKKEFVEQYNVFCTE